MRRAVELISCLLLSLSCSDDKTLILQGRCGETKFPPAPEGTKQIVYVAKNCPTDGADGSREHPYATIELGLQSTEAGGAVLIGPGTYNESMTMTQPVTVVGGTDEQGAGVVIAPSGVGARITMTNVDDKVSLSGIRIEGAKGYGLLLLSGQLTLSDVTIAATARGTLTDVNGQSAEVGFGLAATGGRVDGTRVTIEGSADTGVLISGANGSLRDSQIRGNGLGGVRLQRVAEGFTIDKCALADNAELGVGVFAGPVTLSGNTITGTRLHSETGIGDGLLISRYSDDTSPLAVIVTNNTVTGSERVGLLLGASSAGEIADNEIADSGSKAIFGAGVWLQTKAGRGAGLRLHRNTIRRSRFIGIGVTSDSAAMIEENTIEQTASSTTILESGGNGLIGDGVSLFNNSTVQLRANTIKGSARYGVVLDSTDTGSSVKDNIILSDPAAPMQAGIAIQQDITSSALVALVANNTEDGQSNKVPVVAEFSVRKKDFAQVMK